MQRRMKFVFIRLFVILLKYTIAPVGKGGGSAVSGDRSGVLFQPGLVSSPEAADKMEAKLIGMKYRTIRKIIKEYSKSVSGFVDKHCQKVLY